MSRTSRTRVLDRRQFLAGIAAATVPLAGCGQHLARKRFPGKTSEFERVTDLSMPTLRIGPKTGRTVLVLHELPGLTRDDLALARGLGSRGFNVHVPVLFGSPEQESTPRGFFQACSGGEFECSDLSARSPILDKLEPLTADLARRSGHPVGVVGMCLTGILPLALLSHGAGAAVVCQPTLPFNARHRRPIDDQIPNLGLDETSLIAAAATRAPFLAIRYEGDRLCPPERLDAIRTRFAQQVAAIELAGGHHSSLADDFDETAFEDAVDYLQVTLGAAAGPRRMRHARVGAERRPCEIGADRAWHAVSAG